MPSRRAFLTTMAASLGASTLARQGLAAAATTTIKGPVKAPIGIQLWTFREYLPKDLAGTLAKVRALGFRDVEGAGLWKHTVAELRSALDAADLRCTSAHMGFERLRDDAAGAMAEAKALGARSVYCAWIPHKDAFTREDTLGAAKVFNGAGKAATDAGLVFGYHTHGYENVASPEGTLLDTLIANMDPVVKLQVDVFHTFHGGGDPVKVIERYASRVRSLHLKDISKTFPVEKGKGTAPAEADVPLGSGQIDWPVVLRAAEKAGAVDYFVEDESADPFGHVPKSVAYLQSLKL